MSAEEHTRLPEWSDLDRWNMHTALARVIADGVRAFRKGSLPCYPAGLTPKKWKKILKQIEVGFQAFADELDDGPMMTPKSTAQFDKAMALFVRWHGAMWT